MEKLIVTSYIDGGYSYGEIDNIYCVEYESKEKLAADLLAAKQAYDVAVTQYTYAMNKFQKAYYAFYTPEYEKKMNRLRNLRRYGAKLDDEKLKEVEQLRKELDAADLKRAKWRQANIPSAPSDDLRCFKFIQNTSSRNQMIDFDYDKDVVVYRLEEWFGLKQSGNI